MRPFLLTYAMNSNSSSTANAIGNSGTGSGDATGNGGTSNDNLTIDSLARIAPILRNPREYSFFDMRFVSNYINNQITYYYITGAILANEQPQFQ